MINRTQLNILLAFGIGSGMGALVAYRMAKKAFETELDKQIADVKANYRYLRKDDYESPTDFIEKNHPELLVDESLQKLEINEIVEHAKLNETMKNKVTDYQTGSILNIFEADVKDKDLLPADANETLYENLKATRTDTKPFLISVNEYFEDNQHYQKQSVTYFTGDDVVCFEDDSIMLDPEESFGLINLSRFGVMSDSEDIVYVRNPRIDTDYEIVRHEGKYADMIAHLMGPIEDD